MRRIQERLTLLTAVLRRVAGVPDYDRYVAHVRACHPGTEPLGWADFYAARLEERYNKPGARCC